MNGPMERLRAVLVGAVAMALAVGAHLMASGHAPPLGLPLGLVAATIAPGAVLLGRHALTAARLVPALAVLQAVAHVELTVLLPGPDERSGHGAGSHVHGGHLGHSGHPGALATTTDGAPGLVGLVPTPHMLLAHMLAVVGTALLLAAADRAAARLQAWLTVVAVLVEHLLPVPGHARRHAVVIDGAQPGRLPARLGVGGLRFRGPPRTRPRPPARVTVACA